MTLFIEGKDGSKTPSGELPDGPQARKNGQAALRAALGQCALPVGVPGLNPWHSLSLTCLSPCTGWSTRKENGGDGKPFSFQPGKNLIQGWTDGVLQMRVGERAEIHVPSALGKRSCWHGAVGAVKRLWDAFLGDASS